MKLTGLIFLLGIHIECIRGSVSHERRKVVPCVNGICHSGQRCVGGGHCVNDPRAPTCYHLGGRSDQVPHLVVSNERVSAGQCIDVSDCCPSSGAKLCGPASPGGPNVCTPRSSSRYCQHHLHGAVLVWTGRFWLNHAARRSWVFDTIYWKYLDERFFGERGEDGPTAELWKTRVSSE